MTKTHITTRRDNNCFSKGSFSSIYNISSYWGSVNQDEQMLKNAAYIKEHYLDKGKLGVQTGEGFYSYPDPAFAAPDFLSVPDISEAERIARLAFPS